MTRSELMRRLEELLEQPANSLSGSEELEALDWDSLKALEFLAMVDELFGGEEMSPVELVEVRVVDDLIATLGSRIT